MLHNYFSAREAMVKVITPKRGIEIPRESIKKYCPSMAKIFNTLIPARDIYIKFVHVPNFHALFIQKLVHIRTQKLVHIRTQTHLHTQTQTYTRRHSLSHTQANSHTHTHLHTNKWTYTHAYIHIHKHISTHYKYNYIFVCY